MHYQETPPCCIYKLKIICHLLCLIWINPNWMGRLAVISQTFYPSDMAYVLSNNILVCGWSLLLATTEIHTPLQVTSITVSIYGPKYFSKLYDKICIVNIKYEYHLPLLEKGGSCVYILSPLGSTIWQEWSSRSHIEHFHIEQFVKWSSCIWTFTLHKLRLLPAPPPPYFLSTEALWHHVYAALESSNL